MNRYFASVIVVFAPFMVCAHAMAGTTELSSPNSGPSGIVQQDIANPMTKTTIINGTRPARLPALQTPTSPQPALKNKGALAPLLLPGGEGNSSQPVLRERITTNSPKPASGESKVEDFFQIGPSSKSNSRQSETIRSAELSAGDKRPAGNEQKSFKHSLSRFTWHLLDNMGVPMFYGNNEEYIDPGISRETAMPKNVPPPRVTTHVAAIKVKERSSNRSSPASAGSKPRLNPEAAADKASVPPQPASLHKIPDSELEGTDVPAPKDGQTQTP